VPPLAGGVEKKPKRPLAQVARLKEDGGKDGRISIKDLTLLDGEKFDLALQEKNKDQPAGAPDDPVDLEKNYKWEKHGYIGENDDSVFVVRLSAEKRAPETPTICPEGTKSTLPPVLPERAPSAAPISTGPGSKVSPKSTEAVEEASQQLTDEALKADEAEKIKQAVLESERYFKELAEVNIETYTPQSGTNGRSPGASASTTLKIDGETVPVDVTFYFRSPEGLIRFLGRYLEETESKLYPVYAFQKDGISAPVFSVEPRHKHGALVSARVNGDDYSILDDKDKSENMQVLGLVEEIVNLQKSSNDRPATVPVHVLP
jgi:hypothetical protein